MLCTLTDRPAVGRPRHHPRSPLRSECFRAHLKYCAKAHGVSMGCPAWFQGITKTYNFERGVSPLPEVLKAGKVGKREDQTTCMH